MDRTAIIVVAVVGSLGGLSALLGFIAEGANPYNPSPALGICASLFLLAAQITVSVVGGCCGCCTSRQIPSETNRIVGIVCAVVSWILAVIALALFIRGASLNSIGYYQIGLYAGGGVLVILATALGITSFIMLRSQPAANVEAVAVTLSNRPSPQQPPMVLMMPQLPVAVAQNNPGVAMGHPLPSSGADASAANNQEGKQPPFAEVVPIGHQQSQPAVAAEGTLYRPREQPLHTTATTSQPPQVAMPHVHVVQPQLPHPVQLQPQVGTPQVTLAPLPQGTKPQKQQTGIGNDLLLEAGAQFGVHLLTASLSSDNTDPLAMAGGALLSMATDSAGGDTGAADSGDATW